MGEVSWEVGWSLTGGLTLILVQENLARAGARPQRGSGWGKGERLHMHLDTLTAKLTPRAFTRATWVQHPHPDLLGQSAASKTVTILASFPRGLMT